MHMAINGTVELLQTEKCKVDLDRLLDLRAYSGSLQQARLDRLMSDVEAHKADRHLDATVRTVTIDVPRTVTRAGLDLFLQSVLWEGRARDAQGVTSTVIRLKGVVTVTGEPRPLMVQAVYDTFDTEPITAETDDSPNCRFIFIGRNLDKQALLELFAECADATKDPAL